jgi:O-antigen ligase
MLFEGLRTRLPHDVEPGESVTVDTVLQAPAKPGTYYLQWDMVQENVVWFSFKSGVGIQLTLHDIGLASAGRPTHPRTANLPPPVDVQVALNSDTSTIERGRLWRVAFDMFRAHPITGVGPDGFRNLYGPYAGVTDWNKNIYTNNTYIEMFTNLGLLGGLAFLWLALLGAWTALRNVLREPADAMWVIGLGATASALAFLFHGLADYFLFATPIYTIFWLLLAISVLWPRMLSEKSEVRSQKSALLTSDF